MYKIFKLGTIYASLNVFMTYSIYRYYKNSIKK